MGAGETAQQAKVVSTKADDVSLLPGRTRWKERLDARKLSSDLHVHSKARSCPHIYTNTCVLTHAQT